MSGPVLELRGISVSFSGAQALDSASLCLKKGEIHALLGENGAGKTTLARVMAGLCPADTGEILREGEEIAVRTPLDAEDAGVGLTLGADGVIGDYSVLTHFRLADHGSRSRRRLRKQAEALFERCGFELDLDAPLRDLSPEQRLWADTLRMLLNDCDVLIFDEPDEILSIREMEALWKLWRMFREEGKTVLFLTRQAENALKADRVTVLRSGVTGEALLPSEREKDELLRMMAGKKTVYPLRKKDVSLGSVALEVRDLSVRRERGGKEILRRVSLEARSGEITAILSFPGDALPALAEAIAGLTPMSGRVRLMGRDISPYSARIRAKAGISYLPGAWAKDGMLERLSLADNMLLRRYREGQFQESGLFRRGEVRRFTETLLDQAHIGQETGALEKAGVLEPAERRLLALERETHREFEVLLAVEPARGLNEAEATEVYNRLISVRDNRRAVLLLTTDVEEALTVADRILVLSGGEITGEFFPGYTSVQELGLARSGNRQRNWEETFDEE